MSALLGPCQMLPSALPAEGRVENPLPLPEKQQVSARGQGHSRAGDFYRTVRVAVGSNPCQEPEQSSLVGWCMWRYMR